MHVPVQPSISLHVYMAFIGLTNVVARCVQIVISNMSDIITHRGFVSIEVQFTTYI